MKLLQKTITHEGKKLILLKRTQKEERHSNDEISTKRQAREDDYPEKQEEVGIEVEEIPLPPTDSKEEIEQKKKCILFLEERKRSLQFELSKVNSSLKQENTSLAQLREQVHVIKKQVKVL